MKVKKVTYALATIGITLIEVMIALFVNDNFIRPYVGDMLVVVLLYTFLKVFFIEKPRILPLYVFLFATSVEMMQGIRIVELLGLQDNRFFSVLIGTTYDMKDIVCYAVGCILCGVWEFWQWKRGSKLHE